MPLQTGTSLSLLNKNNEQCVPNTGLGQHQGSSEMQPGAFRQLVAYNP